MSATTQHATEVQPAPVTIAQGLLIVQAVMSTVGLLVAVYVVGLLMDLAARLSTFASGFGGGTASPAAAGTSGMTVAVALALVEVVAVVAVSLWAFIAIGRRRGVVRAVLGGLAAAQALLSAAAGVVAGAGPGLVALTVVVGLLVFDVPVLFLLTAPAAAGAWFRGAAAPAAPSTAAPAPVVAPPVVPAAAVPAPRPVPVPRPHPAGPPAPTGWGPAATAVAPSPAARPTGQTTPGGGFALRVDARPAPVPGLPVGGRHATPGAPR